MGFLEAYILISVLGLFSHKIIKNKRKKGNKGFAAWFSVLVIGFPLLLGILIYIGAFNSLFGLLPSLGVANGKDFMFNYFLIFRVGAIPVDYSGLNMIAVILFLSYVPWYVYMKDGSRMLFGQKTYQSGYLWAFLPNNDDEAKRTQKG